MQTHGAVISRSKDSPAGDYLGYQYTTAQFMRCPCMYGYAGTKRHTAFQYGFGVDTGPQVLYDIQNHFRKKFGLTTKQIPDCWVINVYYSEHKFIAWHSDDDHLFGALDGPAEILSISLGADGVFCVKPKSESSTAHALGLGKKHFEKAIEQRNLRRLGSRK